jgi:UDP-GlcNAc:undecaprenyl-phosphate GlcNAc-1-phosphate transferase
VAGSYLGFLPFNLFPAKIMPGYSGKSLAGFFLSLLAILSGAKLATVILLLGIPLIDATFVIIKRLLQKKSPLRGGPDHLHHYLLKSGWTRNQVAIFYSAISLIIGFISLFLNSSQKFYAFLGLIIIFLGITLKAYRRI